MCGLGEGGGGGGGEGAGAQGRKLFAICTHELIPLFNILCLAIVFDFLWEKTPARNCIGLNIVKENLLLLMVFISSRGRTLYTCIFSLVIYLISDYDVS